MKFVNSRGRVIKVDPKKAEEWLKAMPNLKRFQRGTFEPQKELPPPPTKQPAPKKD